MTLLENLGRDPNRQPRKHWLSPVPKPLPSNEDVMDLQRTETISFGRSVSTTIGSAHAVTQPVASSTESFVSVTKPQFFTVTELSETYVVGRFQPVEQFPQTIPESAERLKARKTGEIQFFEKLLHLWGLDEQQGAILLGFDKVTHVRDLLSGATSIRRRDTKDRLKNLIEIRAALHTLYRDDAVERTWLRERRAELDNRCPLDLLLEGSMENLLRVRQFVEYLSGR